MLSGYTFNLSQQYTLLALVRYESNGIVDRGFGRKGIATLPANLKKSTATSIALQSCNKIVAGGTILLKGS